MGQDKEMFISQKSVNYCGSSLKFLPRLWFVQLSLRCSLHVFLLIHAFILIFVGHSVALFGIIVLFVTLGNFSIQRS